jgi:peptidylprolyl isomerase
VKRIIRGLLNGLKSVVAPRVGPELASGRIEEGHLREVEPYGIRVGPDLVSGRIGVWRRDKLEPYGLVTRREGAVPSAPIRSLALFATALLCLVISPPLRVAAADTNTVARVGEAEVKADELRALLCNLDPRDRAALAHDSALLNRTVRTLLVQRLVLQEALASQWDKQPTVVAQLERLRQSAIIESYLDAAAVAPAGYPSEAELQSAYDANRAAFLVPRQFRLAQIFVGAPKSPNKDETDKAQAKLDAVVKKLRQPEADFAALAKAQSEEAESAARGGEIGWLPENRIQPEIRLRVLGQAKDVVSEPIRLEDGWHIIKILDIKESYTAPLTEVHEQLAAQMRTERAKVERQKYLARLLQKSPISVNELAVSNVLEKPAK